MSTKITVKGSVGIDPELREFDKNKKARFTVASNNLVKGQQVTTWFNVEAWNGNTKLILERIKKGQIVEVTGSLRLAVYRSKKHNDHRVDATITLESFRILPKESNNRGEIIELTA